MKDHSSLNTLIDCTHPKWKVIDGCSFLKLVDHEKQLQSQYNIELKKN